MKPQLNSMIRKPTKTRTKTRKPKFLSLRLALSPEKTRHGMTSQGRHHQHHQQLNLFPLHPENLLEDKEPNDDHVATYFFDAADGGADSLTTLLGAGSSSEVSSADAALLTYALGGHDGDDDVALVRTAMRSRERDASEEKWVCYSEVVERREEEVTSCFADHRCKGETTRGLSLKLDHQKILTAWSGKGSFFIPDLESPQTVPDLSHDNFNGVKGRWESNGGLWEVPERSMKAKEEDEAKVGQREASVLRYKEKRQSRLFSKRIRYQVRKINAEKRPRLKGRFVKRS